MSVLGRPGETEVRVVLGRYPTPVKKLAGVSGAQGELWLKDDGVTSELYGGNKVRKLERTLAMARRKGAERVVTVGAAGSHHVFATALYARRLGLDVAAVLCPQPWSDHAEQMLRLTLGQGIELRVASSQARSAWVLARLLARGDYLLPPGGSNVAGTLGYVDGLRELAEQVRSGMLPLPDVIVVALGSGGTVGGLLAGVVEQRLDSRVLGVTVATGRRVARLLALGLGRASLRRLGREVEPHGLCPRLMVDDSELGRGYGYPTNATAQAISVARGFGLQLDDTYTAKAFSAALRLVRGTHALCAQARQPILGNTAEGRASGRPLHVVYWHTLSGHSLEPLERQAFQGRLPAHLRALLPRG